jgi:GWxTD domain-containing protein
MEGHLRGGLLCMGVLLLGAPAGCVRGPSERTAPRAAVVGRPLEVFRQAGLITGPESFPVVGSITAMAGPGDSTYLVVGLSLPNSALRFQRDGAGFSARYHVSLAFQRDGEDAVRRVERDEVVRVATFQESGRTDESIIFQEAVALEPGVWQVRLLARDGSGGGRFMRDDTLTVPAFDASTASAAPALTAPLLVHQATARSDRSAPPELILNPRRTVPYGGQGQVYVEGYGLAAGTEVRLRVLDATEQEVWTRSAPLLRSDGGVAHALVDLDVSALPLGRLSLELQADGAGEPVRAPLLVTISDQWMVANFDEVLELLAYIATEAELDSLRASTGAERRELWERFWSQRDPVRATQVNEFRDTFFERVRVATFQFGEPNRPGWKTDRGEVFIVLGAPDFVGEVRIGRDDLGGSASGQEWIYERVPGGRLTLIFVDRSGLGRFELTPASASTFRSVARRLRRQ